MQFASSLLLSVYKPAASRRHKRNATRHNSRNKHDQRLRLGKLNAAQPLLNYFRQRLPVQWQYGVRWTFVTRVWNVSVLGFTGYLIYYFFYKTTHTEINEMAQKYTYIRDDQGRVVDIGYKPIIDSARHARKRVSRMMEEIQQQQQQQWQQQQLEEGVLQNQGKSKSIQQDGAYRESHRTSEVKR